MATRKIIVGFDRSADAKAAAAWALDEAVRTGAPVEFFYAWEWPNWMPAASMVPAPSVWPDGQTEQAIKDSLKEAAASAKQTHPGVRTATSIVYGGAAATLIGRSADAGLVVLGSRGHSAVANLLGSVGAAVTAHSRCPVVVVRGEPAVTAPVVAGVDDSPAAGSTVAFAADHAAARGVPLRLIRAWKPATAATPTITADERRPFDELVDVWREKYPDLEIAAEAVAEHPAAALTAASAAAQLLVVGSRGRGTVRGLVLGSVSQHLLRHAACSVAVVHGATF